MRIVIDTREQQPWVFSSGADIERATLHGCDYSVAGHETRIGIERKSLDDLIGSLTHGRERFARSLSLLRAYAWRVIIVEAPLSCLLAGWYTSRATPTSMLGSVCSIMVDGIPVVFADDAGAAAALAERWLRKAAQRAAQRAAPRKDDP